MKEELEKLNRWLIETKNMNIQPQIDEYLEKFKKPIISIREAVDYAAMLCIVKPQELYTSPKTIKERVSNRHALARGFIVKYVLSKNLFGITTSNVYQKIFGFPKDHSTAIYWRDQEFTLDDLRLYQSLHKFLDNKEIVWEK
jgi:hypothetical protein